MLAGVTSSLLASLAASRPLAVILALGLLTLFVLLAVLVWTRFGQARPVSKCVILSLLAHLLLLIYAYSTHILYGPPGRWTGQIVTVRLRDAADDVEAAPVKSATPKPWEQAGKPDVPLLLAAPADPKDKQPPEPEPKSEQPTSSTLPAEPIPPAKITPEVAAHKSPPAEAVFPAHQRPVDQPRLTDLLPDTPSGKTSAAEPLPANPLRDSDMVAPAETLAVDAATSPPAEQNQFVAATTSPPRRLGDGQNVPEPLQARWAADRLKAAQPFGASPRTEAAVAAALDWLASAQSSDGRWDADAHGAGR